MKRNERKQVEIRNSSEHAEKEKLQADNNPHKNLSA